MFVEIVKTTPVYLSLGNMSTDMLRSHNGIELCGYMPVSLASKAKQRRAKRFRTYWNKIWNKSRWMLEVSFWMAWARILVSVRW